MKLFVTLFAILAVFIAFADASSPRHRESKGQSVDLKKIDSFIREADKMKCLRKEKDLAQAKKYLGDLNIHHRSSMPGLTDKARINGLNELVKKLSECP